MWRLHSAQLEQSASPSGSRGEDRDRKPRKPGLARWPWHSGHNPVPARSARGTARRHWWPDLGSRRRRNKLAKVGGHLIGRFWVTPPRFPGPLAAASTRLGTHASFLAQSHRSAIRSPQTLYLSPYRRSHSWGPTSPYLRLSSIPTLQARQLKSLTQIRTALLPSD